MIKTSTDTAKMIIRDVLDDDIEVAIKVKFFYCDKFSTEGYKGKKKV